MDQSLNKMCADMKKRNLKIFPIVSAMVFALALTGCEKTVVPVAAEPDLVSTRIAGASEKAANALDTIAGIEQQKTPIAPQEDDFSNAPPQLLEPISVRWSGPIEQIVRTLAVRGGLRLSVLGARPVAPVTVSIDVYQKPMVEVLRDIGLQAGQRADLRLNAGIGVVELRYAPADRL